MANLKEYIMENQEKDFLRQVSEARTIETVKLKEWENKAKQFIPVYASEYLFYRKTGIVAQMLQVDPERGFIYDPTILKQGVDILLKIAEGQQSRGADENRLATMFTNFADAETRIGYFISIIDQLDIYPSIGQSVIKDLKKVAENTQDEEVLEVISNRIKNIESRAKMQRKALEERFGRQPQ